MVIEYLMQNQAVMRLIQIIFLLLLSVLFKPVDASQFSCPKGDPVTADLGDNVVMRTCMWKKDTKATIRVGPLELVKNGIVILRTQTNSRGKLHGLFSSWDDNGLLTDEGNYSEGLKEGNWMETGKDGHTKTIHYQAGVPSRTK